MINKKIRTNRGFTLIELMVVVSIISLLSSVVLASLNSAREKAKMTAFRQETKQFVNAVELYKSDNNGNIPLISGQSFEIDQNGTKRAYDLNIAAYDTKVRDRVINSLTPYLSEFPTPPSSGTFTFFNGDNLLYYCGPGKRNSQYVIYILGVQNISYFSDWEFIYYGDALLSNKYKCFAQY